MTTPERNRILSTAYRILNTTDEEQARAIDRLTTLTSFAVAFEVWLLTNPDPALVSKVIDTMVLVSPMRDIVHIQAKVKRQA